MKKLNNEELKNIRGGSISLGFGLAIGALVTFFIGVIDGYIRPLSCH